MAPTIGIGIFFSVFFSFLIIYFMSMFPGFTIWASLFLVMLSSFICTIVLYNKGGLIDLKSLSLDLRNGLKLIGTNNVTLDIPNYTAVAVQNQSTYVSLGNLFLLITFVLIITINGIEKKVNDAIEIIQDCTAGIHLFL